MEIGYGKRPKFIYTPKTMIHEPSTMNYRSTNFIGVFRCFTESLTVFT